MRTDGHNATRVAPHGAMPPIDHEAVGPVSALVRLTRWLGRQWGEYVAVTRLHAQLMLESRRWL